MASRVALVTGASSGIGLSIARALAPTFRVALLSSNARRLDQAKEHIAHQVGYADLVCVQADVTERDEVIAAVDLVISHFGDIDVLVNCAGIGGGGVTQDFADESWLQMINTNLTSVFRVTSAVLQKSRMLENRWGRIINVASTGGKQGVMYAAAYSASKHGVVGFTKSLGLELAKTGVTVNAVCPGFVETPLSERARSNYARLWNCTVEDAKQRIEQRIPLGRYVETDEVASFVAYLASDATNAIIAQAINVCGGLGNY